MATNIFFRNYDNFNEQNLIDDLVIESIRMYGLDMTYLTRSLEAVDKIMNEDSVSIFDQVYDMEMYVKSVDGFEGEGDFLSKFGLQIRDQATFSVAIRTFDRYVRRLRSDISRPNEGDLLYMPLNSKFFKIMHVEHENVFYQLGSLQVYDLKCELFEYSNERFETGRTKIDNAFDNYNTDGIDNLQDLSDFDPLSRNFDYEEKGEDIIDFSESDPFSENIDNPSKQ